MIAQPPTSAQPPTLGEQIVSVQWAEQHVALMARRARMRASKIEELRRCLEAAVETLQFLEFGRAVLR